MTSFTSGTWLPDKIDRPTTWTASSPAARTICGGRQADALVDDFHADIAGADGDLLGAVGVAVEAGLADQEFDAAAEFGGDGIDGRADGIEAGAVALGCGLGDARGRAVFAEDPAQGHAPFARRDAGFRGGDRTVP